MKIKQRKLVALAFIVLLFASSIAWMRWLPAKRFEFIATGKNEVRIMTWNVGYFSAVKNKNLRDVDLKSISGTISEVDADVVILQELGTLKQAEGVVGDLGEKWEAYSTLTGHGNQTLSVITRLDRHKIEEFECGGRKVIAASLLSQNNISINILGIHSPHPARGIDANLESIKCALKLSKNMDEEVRIVAGDMNYNLDTESSENTFYREILKEYGDGTVGLGETYYSHTRIDHLFHYPKGLYVNESSSGLLDLPLRFAKVPGFRDHRPIIVTYDLANK